VFFADARSTAIISRKASTQPDPCEDGALTAFSGLAVGAGLV
jgi:hypothetical protein